MALNSLNLFLENADRLRHALDVVEEMRERVVTLLGHTCQPCEREHKDDTIVISSIEG